MSFERINIHGLGKLYKIPLSGYSKESYYALRDVLTESFASISSFKKRSEMELWALRDINLNIKEGEHVGIIGKNGSGKTTLLKLISRITEPTKGKITLRGRTASLLEVGTGFHPELTGRENIYLNGSILGMTRKEIAERFNEIVSFAEIEKFLDTPVKRYSSGMYLRLAFSVAAHLQPEIMLIDEVLAVGDAAFQRKCIGKLEGGSHKDKTILFVSHNMTAVKQLCNRVIWLDNGVIMEDGSTEDVINKYLMSASRDSTEKVWDDVTAPGNENVKINSIKISPENPEDSVISTDTSLKIEFTFSCHQPESEINLSFILWTLTGECVFNTASDIKKVSNGRFKGICIVPANLLNSNVYSIELMVIKDRSFAIYKQKDIISFEVHDGKRVDGWYGKWVGVVRPKLDFKLESIDS